MSSVQKTDAEMIETIDAWPCWPNLPLKRRTDDGGIEIGAITADYPNVVLRRMVNAKGILLQLRFESSEEELDALGMFDPRHLIPESARPMYDALVTHRYETVEAMLEDGWQVD